MDLVETLVVLMSYLRYIWLSNILVVCVYNLKYWIAHNDETRYMYVY